MDRSALVWLLTGAFAAASGGGARALPGAQGAGAGTPDALQAGFRAPPPSARPDAFWAWLDGAVDVERLEWELAQMRRVGLGRAQIWDVAAHHDPRGLVPDGPAFLGPESLAVIARVERRARELGLELGLLNASGWNAGGTWIGPQRAGLALYASALELEGPARVEAPLPDPELPAACPRGPDGRPLHALPVAVQAIALDAGGALAIPDGVVDLAQHVRGDGTLVWDAPPGRWRIVRLVAANHGQELIVPSPRSRGLQIDFFDADDTRFHFEHVLERLESAVGPLAESAFRYLEVDSLEIESGRLTIWTEAIVERFRARRGYDPVPYLALLTGARASSPELAERFLFDWTRMVADLLADEHYGAAQALLEERGLYLCAEAGGPGPPIWESCPADALQSLGRAGLMRGEFWAKNRSMFHVKQVASAAHVYGRTVVDAEAFTSWRHWRDGPHYLQLLADQAFVDGLNHVTFHTFTHSPAAAGLPGFAYHAGTHFNPNVVWWRDAARPFVDYLSRASFLLQQGLPVADVLWYVGAQAPSFHPLAVDVDPALRAAGYDYDLANPEVLAAARVEDGRVVLPSGTSYALLVLPDREVFDVGALEQVARLVAAGATVVGPRRPVRAAGLRDHRRADARVRELAADLWGDGAGPVVQGTALPALLARRGVAPDVTWKGDARTRLRWIHRRTPDAHLYLVVNEHERWEELDVTFRATGRPERWDAFTGRVEPCPVYEPLDGSTRVRLRLSPGGSAFVVFRGRPEPNPVVAVSSSAAPPGEPPATHGDLPNGPLWISSGQGPPAQEHLVLDLDRAVDLEQVLVTNWQHPTRGLLHLGVRAMDVAVSADGEAYRPLGRVELRPAPEIGERDHEQALPLAASGVRYVRLDAFQNHSTPFRGTSDVVALGRLRFVAGGRQVSGVTVHSVSSGAAHDPAGDDRHPPPRPALELVAGDPLRARVWWPGTHAVTFADGQVRRVAVESLPPPRELEAPWELRFPDFPEGWGAPPSLRLEGLRSWTALEDPDVRHFSGTARYLHRFSVDAAQRAADLCAELDLGRVEEVARVTLNGTDLGVLWRPPYRVELTGRLREGPNELLVEVSNTWHNRLVGDAALPEGRRRTRTNMAERFAPDTGLLEAGLLGPVRIHFARWVAVEAP